MIEEANYRSDPRVRGADSHWWDKGSFNEAKMTATFSYTDYDAVNEDGEDSEAILEIKMSFQVCSVCDGKGTHVNPSIDASGLSSDAFADDPEFAEGYHSGRYDVRCYTCDGKRVEPVMSSDNAEEVIKRIDDYFKDMADDWAEAEAERRMGC